MIVVVSGTRNLQDIFPVFLYLDRLHAKTPVTQLHHGGCRGVDKIAGEWAESRGVPVTVHEADWDKHGLRAGPVRNVEMLELDPDHWVAFPDPASKGTRHFIRVAQERNLPGDVIELPVPGRTTT